MSWLAGNELDNISAPFSYIDHFAADLQPDLVDDANDVPLRRIAVRPDHEVGGREKEEVDIMILHIACVVVKLPYQLGRRRWLNTVEVIQCLSGRHVVRCRTNPTYVGYYSGHLFGRPAQTEPLKSP